MPPSCCESTAPTTLSANLEHRTVIYRTDSRLTFADRWDHWTARWGYRRNAHRVEPGLYALGAPSCESSVFVTANYTLSFDALRQALDGMDGYILVLDTKGVNVWCAAGKGTFSTDELANRIERTGLADIVCHRRLILPQLGAAGVSAHEVRKRTGFAVSYGPVRAEDLPQYLESGQASAEMRQVRFNLKDRLPLIPIEIVHVALPLMVAAIVLYLANGPLIAAAAVAAVLAGAALFPIMLPWLPTRDFSSKGLILGSVIAVSFASAVLLGNTPGLQRAGIALALVLALPPVTGYLSLNFTGSTTFTSKSGVAREMATYIPVMAWLFGSGVVLWLVTQLLRWFHVI